MAPRHTESFEYGIRNIWLVVWRMVCARLLVHLISLPRICWMCTRSAWRKPYSSSCPCTNRTQSSTASWIPCGHSWKSKGKGLEHSHYPTHPAKRIITQIAAYWAQARVVNPALPAVAEDMSKLKLLDINHPVDLVVCGHNKDGNHFVERVPLP